MTKLTPPPPPAPGPLLVPRPNFTTSFLTLLPAPCPKQCRETRKRYCSQSITLCVCHSFLLTLFSCSSVGHLLGMESLRKLWLQCGRNGSCQKTCSCLGFSAWATAPARSLLQCGMSVGCRFLQVISTCCNVGSYIGCSVAVSYNMVACGLHGHCLVHHSLLHTLLTTGCCLQALLL